MSPQASCYRIHIFDKVRSGNNPTDVPPLAQEDLPAIDFHIPGDTSLFNGNTFTINLHLGTFCTRGDMDYINPKPQTNLTRPQIWDELLEAAPFHKTYKITGCKDGRHI